MTIPPVEQVLANNMKAILERDRISRGLQKLSAKAWAEIHKLDPKIVQRALKPANSPTLDTVQRLSDAADLAPWQLLFPGLDPGNPPVFVMSKYESDLYAKFRQAAQSLPEVKESTSRAD